MIDQRAAAALWAYHCDKTRPDTYPHDVWQSAEEALAMSAEGPSLVEPDRHDCTPMGYEREGRDVAVVRPLSASEKRKPQRTITSNRAA